MTAFAQENLLTRQTFMSHFDAELRDDLEDTMATVGAHPTYALVQRASAAEDGRLVTITDHADVRAFYAAQAHVVGVAALRIVTSISNDWYEFVENVPTRHHQHPERFETVNSVTLIPRDGAHIQGEFLWERTAVVEAPPSCATPAELAAVGSLPMGRLRNARIHEEYLDALREGRLDDILAAMVAVPIWTGRDYSPRRAAAPLIAAEGACAVRGALESWRGAFEIEHISVLSRLVTDWYVFAEELYTVTMTGGSTSGRRREFRNAVVYPITTGGAIEGALGYGAGLTDPSPASVHEVGRVAYLAPGYSDPTIP